MKNFAQVRNGKITQIAIGFIISPFEDGVIIGDEIINNPEDWEYIDGSFRKIIKEEVNQASYEEYFLDLDFRLSIIELGL